MALDGNRLGAAMAAAVKAVTDNLDGDTAITDTDIENIWKAAGNEIIDEIVNNAVINVTGVQTGPGTAPGSIS